MIKDYNNFFDDLTDEINNAFDFTKHIEDTSNVTDKYLDALINFNIDFMLAIDNHTDFTTADFQTFLDDKNSIMYKDTLLLSELVEGLKNKTLEIRRV